MSLAGLMFCEEKLKVPSESAAAKALEVEEDEAEVG